MRARDAGVSAVAVVAAFLALQGTPDVDIQLRWLVGERPLSREGNLPVPLPLVTDLDGDGKNEVVVLADGGMLVRVLSVPVASGETLVDPWILHETKLIPTSRARGETRAVAIAAGYLEPPVSSWDSARGQQRQLIVVVREDASVVCFDHQLNRLWGTSLEHEGADGDGGSFVVDQVAITVTHSVRKLDDRGRPRGGTAEGLIVVGVSMRHRDGRFHHSRAGRDPSGSGVDGLDPLGVHVEAFVEGEEDSRDAVEEAEMTEEEKGMRAAQHFSLFALDGESGKVRWKHDGGAHHGDLRGQAQDDRADEERDGHGGGSGHEADHFDLGFDLDYSGFAGDFFYDQTPGAAAFEGLAAAAGAPGGGGGRRYRRSLLRHLPHAWSAPSDTRLEVTALHRKGPSDSSRRSGGASGISGDVIGERAGDHSAADRRRLPPAASSRGGGGAQGWDATRATGGGAVRVVLARTREGLEAVELSTGKPLSAVALPAVGSGAGVYVDLNGDGVVDHVQAVGTRGEQGWGHLHAGVAMGHLSEEPPPSQAQQARRPLPPCYALAVSGLPPREQLFNGSLCHNAGALFEVKGRLSKPESRSASRSLDVEVGAASPAIIQRASGGAAAGAAAATRSGRGAAPPSFDAVFAVSSGVVSSYDDEGRLQWQDRRGPTWMKPAGVFDDGVVNSIGGYVVPLTLEVGRPGREGGRGGAGSTARSRGAEERILVVGQDKMCVYDCRGRLVGSTLLVAAPAQRPVLGDFDGDGVVDVLIVGWAGAAAGYALTPDPGVRALFVAVLALVAAMLVVAALYVPPPSSGSGAGGRLGMPGGKSKRATD